MRQRTEHSLPFVAGTNIKAFTTEDRNVDDAEAYYQHAKKLVKENGKWEMILFYAEKAVELASQNVRYIHYLATCYLQWGDVISAQCQSLEASSYYQKALYWYQKANDPFGVGKVYHKLGKGNSYTLL